MKFDLKNNLKKSINENIEIHKKLLDLSKDISVICDSIYNSLKSGGKLIFCGNGGSAADAQHLVAECLIRLRSNVNRKAIPAITLATDTSTITACGNDYSYGKIFERPFEGLANKKDILIAISTSGNSKNIINVLKSARKNKILSICLLGSDGGLAKNFCDLKLIIPSSNTARIQECHIFLGHYIIEKIENLILSDGKNY